MHTDSDQQMLDTVLSQGTEEECGSNAPHEWCHMHTKDQKG